MARALIQKVPSELKLPKFDGMSLTFVGHFLPGVSQQIAVITPWTIKIYGIANKAVVLLGTTPITTRYNGGIYGTESWLSLPFNSANFKATYGDYNNDGLTDIRLVGTLATYYRKQFLSNGNGTFQESFIQSPYNSSYLITASSFLTGKFTNDGSTHEIFIGSETPTSSNTSLTFSTAEGPAMTTRMDWVPQSGSPYRLAAVQNNGYPYAHVVGVSGSKVTVSEITGKSFPSMLSTPANFTLPADVSAWAGPFSGNFGNGPNGSFLMISPTGTVLKCSYTTISYRYNTFNLPEAALLTTGEAAPSWTVADLNADGYEDIIATMDSYALVWTNNKLGTGWIVSKIYFNTPFGYNHKWKTFVGDFDGNGVADLYYARPQGPSTINGNDVDPRESQRILLR